MGQADLWMFDMGRLTWMILKSSQTWRDAMFSLTVRVEPPTTSENIWMNLKTVYPHRTWISCRWSSFGNDASTKKKVERVPLPLCPAWSTSKGYFSAALYKTRGQQGHVTRVTLSQRTRVIRLIPNPLSQVRWVLLIRHIFIYNILSIYRAIFHDFRACRSEKKRDRKCSLVLLYIDVHSFCQCHIKIMIRDVCCLQYTCFVFLLVRKGALSHRLLVWWTIHVIHSSTITQSGNQSHRGSGRDLHTGKTCLDECYLIDNNRYAPAFHSRCDVQRVGPCVNEQFT